MIIFDYERACAILFECANIFEEDSFTAVAMEKDDKFYLRICYKNTQLDFKCYKYC